MLGSGKQQLRGVLVGEDRHDAGNSQRGSLVDGHDPGVRVRRTQELHVQQARELFRRDIQGVAGGACHHGLAGGGGDVVPELAGCGWHCGS